MHRSTAALPLPCMGETGTTSHSASLGLASSPQTWFSALLLLPFDGLMVIIKRLERMFHSQDQGGGFDEIDGAHGSKPKRWAEESYSPSPRWASLQSTYDTSLQLDFHQYPDDYSQGRPNSLISPFEDPACLFPDSFKGADGNHGPIGGPITRTMIGPEGGQLEIYGNVLTIPRGAVAERTKIELGLVWNKCLWPSFGTDCQMTSILSCQPSGLKFRRPVTLTLPHCLEWNPSKGKQIRPVLYSSHHVNDGKPEWSQCRFLGNSVSFQQQRIDVKVYDFCYLVWAFEDDRPDVDAKKIRIVPYASPISSKQDQKIRLYMFNDLEAVRERVKKEEEELGGERLTSYHSYVLLKNKGSLYMEMTWNTVGWVLRTPPVIEVPFREMWACEMNSCGLLFANEGKKLDFKCNIDIQQDDNDSKVVLSFAHDVKIDSPDGPGCVADQARFEEKLSVPQEETKSIGFSSLSLQLPKVPPPPDIATRFLSFTGASISPGMGYRQQNFPTTEGHFSFSPAQPGATQMLQTSLGAVSLGETHQSMIHRANEITEASSQMWSKDTVPMKRRDVPDCGGPAHHEGTTTAIANLNRNQSNATQAPGATGSAIHQFYINSLTVNLPGRMEQHSSHDGLVESKSVIPFQLKKRLSVKLHEEIGVMNWMDLSRYWNLDRKYDEAALINVNRPAYAILTAAEEKQIVRSLNDLRIALRAIGRDDCVAIVDTYEGISAETASDSDSDF